MKFDRMDGRLYCIKSNTWKDRMERTLCARKTDARRKYLELNPAFPCHEAAKIVKSLNYLHARREPPGRNIEESPDYKEGEERMTVREVRDILGARVLVGEDHLDREVRKSEAKRS